MTIILFLIILGALIFVHELGHFVSAKKSGIRVDEFALGFPPTIWSKRSGETTYKLNLVPFGGYVKIFGEDGDDSPASPSFPPKADPSSGGRGGDGRESRVEETTTPPSAPLLRTGGEEKDRSHRFTSKPKWIQALVLSSGILGNLVFAWLLLSLSFFTGIPSSAEGRYADDIQDAALMVTSVLPGSPAEKAGLKAGDRVTAISDSSRLFKDADAKQARDFIADANGPLSIEFDRGGEMKAAQVQPISGIVEGKPIIGVTIDTVGVVKFGLLRSLFEGLLMTVDLVREVAVGLYGFITDAFKGQANLAAVTGPVGIAGLVGEARTLGLVYLFSFTAFISVNLAVINLLPIPALDGGRLLFLVLEGISRRTIPVKISRFLNTLGFLLLILLMVVITYRDIAKLVSS